VSQEPSIGTKVAIQYMSLPSILTALLYIFAGLEAFADINTHAFRCVWMNARSLPGTLRSRQIRLKALGSI
jgi:hypothetical protein